MGKNERKNQVFQSNTPTTAPPDWIFLFIFFGFRLEFRCLKTTQELILQAFMFSV